MSSVNKVILVGNLGLDPEFKTIPSGGMVTNIRIATSEFRKNKATGISTENTEWHRVVLFDRLADLAEKYLTKGSQVYIEGKLRTRKWQAQDGTERYMTEVVADVMQFLGKPIPRTVEPEYRKPEIKNNYQSMDLNDDDVIPF